MKIPDIGGKTKEETLRNAYDWVVGHFSSERYNLFLRVFKQIYVSDEQLMKKKQFAQCTLQNRILIKLLIESGGFKIGDIEKKWKWFWGIHQYLIVGVGGGRRFKVDAFFRGFRKI